jgi:CubicO group peptidase (beta-lactamase class C family)
MPKRIAQRVERAIAERVFPGCVVGTIRANGSREILPFGKLTYDGGEKLTADTVYDLASVTKSVPTASLALELMAEGRFSLGHTVKMFVPELRNDFGATVEDLLRYRVTGLRMSEFAQLGADEMIRHIFEHGFDGPPGESRYTNLPAFILGLVIERATGERLDALARRYFFEPLGMKQTTFFPNVAGCAPTEIVDGQELRGIVHDESARVFAREGRVVGHAGLFSTAGDLLTFLQVLLSGGFPHVAEGAQRGLGWQVHEPYFMGTFATENTFGKTGFTGTSVLCDIERGIGLVILSNRTYPQRPDDATSPDCAINVFRRDIADVVLQK